MSPRAAAMAMAVALGLLAMCCVVSAQSVLVNDTLAQEELLRATEFENIFDLVRRHLNVDNPNPAAVTRVQKLLAGMKAELASEQKADDLEYRRRSKAYEALKTSLNLTIQISQADINDADVRLKHLRQLKKGGFIFLGLMGPRVDSVKALIQAQNQSIFEAQITRASQSMRAEHRIREASDSILGVISVLDTLGSIRSLNYNSTLRRVLNDHHAPTIQSLLEVAAKAGTDDTLDEFRQMLFTMNDLMHNYIKDIATVENNQIVRFNMKMGNMTARLTRLENRLAMLNRTIEPMVNFLHQWKNDTANIRNARGESLLKLAEARKELSAREREWTLYEHNYKRHLDSRAYSFKTIIGIEKIIEERTRGGFNQPVQPSAGPVPYVPYTFTS